MIFQIFLKTPLPALLAFVFLVVSCTDAAEAPAGEAERAGEDALASADSQGGPAAHPGAGAQVAIDWSRPVEVRDLAEPLREISGIAVLDAQRVAAVQDEAGRIYVLDTRSGEITGTYPFGKKGDYEDIALVDGTAWVLRSDATLFEVENWQSTDPTVEEYETPLQKKCDAEGLVYDQPQNRLLISCKEDPGPDMDDARTVYAFDLAQQELAEEPAYTVTFEALAERLASGRTKDAEDFKPSALALHPGTGDLYVLSSVLKALAVVAPGGTVEAVYELPPDLFAQPEGLAFSPEGLLFISNEGPNGPATLLSYNIPN